MCLWATSRRTSSRERTLFRESCIFARKFFGNWRIIDWNLIIKLEEGKKKNSFRSKKKFQHFDTIDCSKTILGGESFPIPLSLWNRGFSTVKLYACAEPGRNSLMERTILSIAGCAPRIFKEAGGKGFSIESRNLSFLLTVQLLRCTCYRLLRGSNVKDDRFVSSWNFSFVVDGERELFIIKDVQMYICRDKIISDFYWNFLLWFWREEVWKLFLVRKKMILIVIILSYF